MQGASSILLLLFVVQYKKYEDNIINNTAGRTRSTYDERNTHVLLFFDRLAGNEETVNGQSQTDFYFWADFFGGRFLFLNRK